MVYYNEFDAKKAAWLRELIRAGVIADGHVDERSIVDVRGSDLAGYTQCHFFAGIGIWSYALRLAGVPDDRPVWTASCPCQPFSAAGKRKGHADERHLWPELARLMRECRPELIIGEQVFDGGGLSWLDTVFDDLEAEAYTGRAIGAPAASVGAPHIRQRLYWVANDNRQRCEGQRLPVLAGRSFEAGAEAGRRGEDGLMGHASRDNERWPRLPRIDGQGVAPGGSSGAGVMGNASGAGLSPREREALHREGRRGEGRAVGEPGGTSDLMEHAQSLGRRRRTHDENGGRRECPSPGGSAVGVVAESTGVGRIGRRPSEASDETGALERSERLRVAGPTNGFWRDADWIPCSDGKARPVEPGSFPLAHGAPARVVRLRGYGDGIVAPQAAEFIRAVMEEIG